MYEERYKSASSIDYQTIRIYQFGKCFYSFGIVFASIIPFDFYNFAALNLILI